MRFASLVLLVLISTGSLKADVLGDIDTDVWVPFTKSYKDNDGELHVSIYHPEIVRVIPSDGKVLSGDAYLAHLRSVFDGRNARGTEGTDIHFRFNQRYHNEDSAYEEGVYRLKGTRHDGSEFLSFGNFRVVLKKHNESWKIMFDADVPTDEAAWDAAPIKISR